MRAKSLTVGLSLAAAGVVTPFAAFAQAPANPPAAPAAPAAPGAAPAAPAPAAPAPAAAPAAPAAEAAPAPAPAGPPAPPPAAEAPAAPPAEAPAPAAAPTEPAAPAEAPPPLATITGYVDAAYHANMSAYSYDKTVPLRSYDSIGGNSFLLHAAHIGVAHSFGPEAAGFISLDFGSDAQFNNFNYAPVGLVLTPSATAGAPPVPSKGVGTPIDVREAYGQWTPGDFLLKAGKFVTLNGIEVVDGPLNPTITRGFLFGLAEPVTHTGVKAQYTLGGIAHVGVGIVNGWDNIVDNNNAKTILFNADVAPSSMFHAQISGSYGSERANVDDAGRLTLDLTGAFVLDALTLNFQGLVGSEKDAIDTNGDGTLDEGDSWFGFGLQPVYTMDMFSLGGRLEYFSNKHGTRTGLGEDTSIFNFTITPGITPTKNFTLRLEYRVDAVLGAKALDPTTNVLADNKEQLNGKSSQHTIAIGASYSF